MPLLSPIWLSRQEGATELYLIRHGDVLSGSDHLMPGGTYDDQPLSSLGQQQAQALATHLETLRFAAIYSSASRRARETAEVLANYHGLPVTIEPDIHEMHVAILEQRLPDDVSPTEHAALLREQLGTVIRAVGDAGQWSDVSAAESRAIYHARVVTALDALAARHTGERIAIFAHGGIISTYLATVIGGARNFFFHIVNTSLSIVRVKEERRMLVVMNDICHLRNAGLLDVFDA
jgi:probable phosphoglycerate mutase